MRQDTDGRRTTIVAMLAERGAMRVADLATELGVSAVTARRDVAELAAHGIVRREHGSVVAVPAGPDPDDDDPQERPLPRQVVVGLLMPRAHYYYGDVIDGARTMLARNGGRVVLGISNSRAEQDLVQVRYLVESGATAIIAAPTWPDGVGNDENAAFLLDLGMPVVLVERRGMSGSQVAALDSVASDHVHGIQLAVRHLQRRGYQHIVLASQPTSTIARLKAGQLDSLGVEGLGASSAEILEFAPSDRDPDVPAQVAQHVARRCAEQGSVGVILHNDIAAILVMQQLRAMGVRVPGQVGIVAYDDVNAALADIPLTAVTPPKREIGHVAAQLVLSRLRDRPALSDARQAWPGSHVQLLPALEVRSSTRRAMGEK